MAETLIAIIDLGTNTFNLLIGEKKKGGLILHTEKRLVKLAEDSDNLDYIRNEPYQRALKAIKEYSQIIVERGVSEVYAYATSGLRSAGNGDQFILDCWMNYKINIHMIDGLKEAELISVGVMYAFPESIHSALIMDIGGGSTEFCIIKNGQNIWNKSYQLGASRLKENLNPDDPLSTDDIKEFEDLFDAKLMDVIEECKKHNVKQLIGSSGSFDTLVDIIELEKGLKFTENYYHFALPDFKRMHDIMLNNNQTFRLKIPGMIPLRSELMPIATLLTDFIINQINIDQLSMSRFSLKEGAFFHHQSLA